jgi:hypothetical protein
MNNFIGRGLNSLIGGVRERFVPNSRADGELHGSNHAPLPAASAAEGGGHPANNNNGNTPASNPDTNALSVVDPTIGPSHRDAVVDLTHVEKDPRKLALLAEVPALAHLRSSKPANSLMDLPPELQLMIIQRLDFGDIERLRLTCHYYRSFVSKKMVKEIFSPNFRHTLLAHCYLCLKYDPPRANLLWADWSDPRYPLASKCVTCAVQRGELFVGRKVSLGNYASVWVCRWCGYPVASQSAHNQPEFHEPCYAKYNNVLVFYFILGWIQLAIGIVVGALCWRYFRDNNRILIPSVVSEYDFDVTIGLSPPKRSGLLTFNSQINFIFLFWCLAILILRGTTLRTYHWAFLLEITILGLWILPVYEISKQIQTNPEPPAQTAVVTLAFCLLNM